MNERDVQQARKIVVDNFQNADPAAALWLQENSERIGTLLDSVDLLVKDFNKRTLQEFPTWTNNTRLVKARFKELPTIHDLLGEMKKKGMKAQFRDVVRIVASEIAESHDHNDERSTTLQQPERIRVHAHRKHNALERVLQFYEGVVLSECFFSGDELDRKTLKGRVVNMFVEMGSFHPKNDVFEQMIRPDRLNWLATREGLNDEFKRSAIKAYRKAQSRK